MTSCQIRENFKEVEPKIFSVTNIKMESVKNKKKFGVHKLNVALHSS